MRPERPWTYWYELRVEYWGLIRLRPTRWWVSLFILPVEVWLGQRSEKSLYEVIPPDVLREALVHWKATHRDDL